MRTGCRCGDRRRTLPSGGLDVFIGEDGGYTSVAVALALLVSLSLTCSLVSVAWLQNRSADVQAVADSTALAGTNVVASYSTVATVLDSCVLTLGLAGMVTLGAGLVRDSRHGGGGREYRGGRGEGARRPGRVREVCRQGPQGARGNAAACHRMPLCGCRPGKRGRVRRVHGRGHSVPNPVPVRLLRSRRRGGRERDRSKGGRAPAGLRAGEGG